MHSKIRLAALRNNWCLLHSHVCSKARICSESRVQVAVAMVCSVLNHKEASAGQQQVSVKQLPSRHLCRSLPALYTAIRLLLSRADCMYSVTPRICQIASPARCCQVRPVKTQTVSTVLCSTRERRSWETGEGFQQDSRSGFGTDSGSVLT